MRINRCDVHRFALPLENYARGSMTARQALREVLSQGLYLSFIAGEDLIDLALGFKG